MKKLAAETRAPQADLNDAIKTFESQIDQQASFNGRNETFPQKNDAHAKLSLSEATRTIEKEIE